MFKKTLINLLILIVAVVVLFLRKQGNFVYPDIYAEDGMIYLTQAFRDGPSAFFVSYAEYIQLITRLGTYLCALLPIRFIAIGFLSFSCAILVLSLSLLMFIQKTVAQRDERFLE